MLEPYWALVLGSPRNDRADGTSLVALPVLGDQRQGRPRPTIVVQKKTGEGQVRNWVLCDPVAQHFDEPTLSILGCDAHGFAVDAELVGVVPEDQGLSGL